MPPSWPKNQNIKQKQYCNKFHKDFKDGSHQKKIYSVAIKAPLPLPDHLSRVPSPPTLACVMPSQGELHAACCCCTPPSSLPTSLRPALWLCRHHYLRLQHSLLHVPPLSDWLPLSVTELPPLLGNPSKVPHTHSQPGLGSYRSSSQPMSHCIIPDSYLSLQEELKARGHASFTTMALPTPAAHTWISSVVAGLRQKGKRARWAWGRRPGKQTGHCPYCPGPIWFSRAQLWTHREGVFVIKLGAPE